MCVSVLASMLYSISVQVHVKMVDVRLCVCSVLASMLYSISVQAHGVKMVDVRLCVCLSAG